MVKCVTIVNFYLLFSFKINNIVTFIVFVKNKQKLYNDNGNFSIGKYKIRLFEEFFSMHYIYVTMITIRKLVDNIGKIKIADTSLSIIFRKFAKNEARVIKPGIKEEK